MRVRLEAGDALSKLVTAASKMFKGEDVDVEELALVVSNDLAQMFGNLYTIRNYGREVKEYLSLIEQAASIIAELAYPTIPSRDFVKDYVSGLIVGTRNCIVAIRREKNSLLVKCFKATEAAAAMTIGTWRPVKLEVNDL